MGIKATLRLVLAVVAMTGPAALLGCAGAAQPQQAPLQQEATTAVSVSAEPVQEPETQPETAPPVEQQDNVARLLAQAEAAIGQWDFPAARDALQQVKGTGLYAGDQAVRDRADELERRLDLAEQQVAEQGAELARILEAVDAAVAAGNFAGASARLAGVKEGMLYERDEKVRAEVAALEEKLQAAEQKAAQESQQVSAMLQEAEAKIDAEQFADAADLLQRVQATGVYAQQKALRDRVTKLNKELTAAKRKAARRLFDQAVQAYETGNYASASGLLDELDRWNVDLGRRSNARLAAMRQEVSAVLEQSRKLFEEGERLYRMGNYEDAAQAFKQIQQLGARCGEELQQAVAQYLADIERQVRAEAVAGLAEKVKLLAELKSRREEALKGLLGKERMRRQALAAMAQADAEWKAGRLMEAQALLQQAKALLEKPQLASDPQFDQARQETEARLAEAVARIEAQKERERKAAELQEMFEEVEKLKGADLLGAENRLVEAQRFAREAELALSPAQQAVAEDVRAAVEAAYGQQRRERAERYWGLVELSKRSVEAGEWEHALELLKLVQQAPNLELGPQRSARLNEQVQEVTRRLQARGSVMEQIGALAAEAQAAVQADRGEEALSKYRDALGLAEKGGIPVGQLGSLLEGYERAAARVLPRVVEAQLSELKALADEAVGQALSSQELLEARFHLEKGSYDLAKPLLVAAAGNDGLAAEQREWARQQLEGIDARITALQGEELLANRELAEAAYALEKEFEAAAARGDLEAAQRLASQIADARTAWLVARAQRALNRGAYATAEMVLQEDPDLLARGGAAPALQDILAKVEQWRTAHSLMSDVTGALKQRQAQGASKALAELQRTKLVPNPLEGVLPTLQAAGNALVQLDAQQGSLQKKQDEALQSIRDALGRDQSRHHAWGKYMEAAGLYGEGDWPKAERVLRELVDYVGALLPFELQRAEQMLDEARQKVEATVRVEQTVETDAMLREAEANIAAGQFARAADLLNALAGSEAYRNSEGVRKTVAELQQRVAAGEDDAARLYQKAREAYQAGDLETLRRLLDELKTKYQHTRFYQQRLE